MEVTGNYKTSQLIVTIIFVYFSTQFLIEGVFWLIYYFGYNLELYEFWLTKLIPITTVSIVLYFIDNFFTKLSKLNGILFIAPILIGDYDGEVHQKGGKNYIVTAKITQTLSLTEFELFSPGGSFTKSDIITFNQTGLNHWKVYINYHNINIDTPEDVKNYDGTVILDYNSSNHTLSGIYFTSRGTIGTVSLKRRQNGAKKINI